MSAKAKNLSPARQREVDRATATRSTPQNQVGTPPGKTRKGESDWAAWEVKIGRLHARDQETITAGWLAHIPEIEPPGCRPSEGVSSIASISDVFPTVLESSSVVVDLTGARPVVLHEAFYLLHKAIHVQISCANAVNRGFHTWAVVDAYQSSLFALAGVLAFLGLTIERDGNSYIVIDVWAKPDSASRVALLSGTSESYHFIRFKALDHFHKWAMLKRILATLKNKSRLATRLEAAIRNVDDRRFSMHRNSVHYESAGWIASDLFSAVQSGPIVRMTSPDEFFEEIGEVSPAGTVYIMCALIEFACELANSLTTSQVIAGELELLKRREAARSTFTEFDWERL